MIPLRLVSDNRPAGWMSRSLIAVTTFAFVLQWLLGAQTQQIIERFGFVPASLFNSSWPAGFLSLFTSLFLHAGAFHLIANMLYLFVFGEAVEARLGRWRFLLLYVSAGVLGSLLHAFLFQSSTIPSIGASGSVAGVLGAFLLLLPGAKIATLLPLIIAWITIEIPAVILLPIWFFMQFASGFLALEQTRSTVQNAGITWWAHVGGFLFGCLVARLWHRGGTTYEPETIS